MTRQDLRIVFLGTPEFAVESLAAIHERGYNIVGVVTMPDKPAGRGHKMLQSPVKQYALSHGLHLMQPVNLKDAEFVDELRSLHADLFVVIAFRMLPEIVWSMPPMGTFNLHASLLPRYRGAAPINRAVMNGDTVTGVTTFMLKHEIDTGDILRQESITIGDDENVGSVHDRLMHLGAELTIDTIEHIIAGDLTPMPQHLVADVQPSAAPKIFKDTCHIDWHSPAKTIHNHIRGLSPYPAAWTEISMPGNDDTITAKIFSGKPISDTHLTLKPGQVITNDHEIYVGTADMPYRIDELQLAGKRRMSAAAFLLGTPLDNAIMA